MIEKAFFKEKSTKWSKWLSYAIVNFFLMVVVFYILLNTIAYDWTGSLYPEGTGFHLDFLGDNLIPFIPEMAIFYIYLFYSMVILSMVYFAFVDGEKGYALSWSLVIINAIAILVYIVFPVSTYWWRQDLFAIENLYKGNFFAEAMFGYYRSDTSFNCLPSLHAAVSVIIFYAWYRYCKIKPSITRKIIAIITLIIATGVVLSTLFVKQHYILDEIAGILLAYFVGKYTYNFLWKKHKLK
ncbi:MAG: phosphatase PAP2 family protein [Promethearchaeota archaeon]